MLFKLNQRQVGNDIGTLIASIGVPMLLNALTGKGVGRGGPRLGTGGPKNRHLRKRGKKRSKGRCLLLGKKSPFNNIPIVGDIL